jgi:Uma2 family endonuclease
MSAVENVEHQLSVEEYLAAEELSQTKHEYLGGFVYAMAGASISHIRIARNLALILHPQLRGGKCEFFGSDLKLKFTVEEAQYFYYPDGMICCDPAALGKDVCERPSVVFEITSDSTRATDEREKRGAYHKLGSVLSYVRIEQDQPAIIVEIRAEDGWKRTRHSGLKDIAEIGLGELKLPLAELYEDVTFPE